MKHSWLLFCLMKRSKEAESGGKEQIFLENNRKDGNVTERTEMLRKGRKCYGKDRIITERTEMLRKRRKPIGKDGNPT